MTATVRDAIGGDIDFIRTSLTSLEAEMREMGKESSFYQENGNIFSIDGHMDRDLFLISVCHGTPVGLISIWLSHPASEIVLLKPPQRAVVNTLFVVPSHRRLGVASQLLNAARRKCLQYGARGVGLSYIDGNLAAENLYRKAGYVASRHSMWLNLE